MIQPRKVERGEYAVEKDGQTFIVEADLYDDGSLRIVKDSKVRVAGETGMSKRTGVFDAAVERAKDRIPRGGDQRTFGPVESPRRHPAGHEVKPVRAVPVNSGRASAGGPGFVTDVPHPNAKATLNSIWDATIARAKARQRREGRRS